jgi:predicted DNA-binding transcriptional regulator AlpA
MDAGCMIKMRKGEVVGTNGKVISRVILRKREVRKRTGLSDTTLWRMEKASTFPARVQLTAAGSVGWYEDEVDRWVYERIRGGGKRPPLADRDKAA